VRQASAFAALFSLFTASCVIGRGTRQSQVETAQGPSGAAVSGAPVQPATTPSNDEPAPGTAKPGAVWVHGYWHWDGTRYVWERGRWQSRSSP